ncbi:MAG: hypothetical protein ACSLFE_00450 [Gemmatimonadaceae bacterium]
MNSDALIAAGQVMGGALSLVIIAGAVKIGSTYKGVVGDVAYTKGACAEIKQTLKEHTPRIEKIEITLHGPLGDNGMYQAVRELKVGVQEIRDQRMGPADRRKESRPGKPRRRRP